MPNSGRGKTALVRKLPKNSNYIWFLAVIPILVIVIALVTFSGDKPKVVVSQPCGPYRTDKVLHIGSNTINAEVVSSQTDLAKGLGGRPCILANQGMLFMLSTPGYYKFWMKDMRFPIDMIWIGANHKVVTSEFNVQPSTYPGSGFINQGQPAQYVLEIKANRSLALHIQDDTLISF